MGLFDAIGSIFGSSQSGGNNIAGLPSLAGMAGNIGMNWIQNEMFNKEASNDAWDRAQKASAVAFDRSYDAYKRRYQDTVADMKLAGINPIMAASGGFNVGTSPNMTPATARMATAPDYESFTSGARNFAAAGTEYKRQAEIVMKTKEARARTNESIAKTYVERAKKGLITAQERQAVKNTQLLDKQIWTQMADFQKKVQEGYKANAEKKLILVRVKQLKTVMHKLESISDVYKTPYFGQFVAFLNSMLNLSGSAGAVGTMKLMK